MEIKPTVKMVDTIQYAYDFFNDRLWNGRLPECMILFQRKNTALGYYSPGRFRSLEDPTIKVDEIAINPDHILRGDKAVLSTLVHEMVHLWQQHYGKPSRGNYHNREWAAEMKRVGLFPSSTGQPGGKQTGQAMSHYVMGGGHYEAAYNDFAELEATLQWASGFTYYDLMKQLEKVGKGKEDLDNEDQELLKPKVKKPKSKQKFTCPECGQNAWAKPTASIGCWDCNEEMIEA